MNASFFARQYILSAIHFLGMEKIIDLAKAYTNNSTIVIEDNGNIWCPSPPLVADGDSGYFDVEQLIKFAEYIEFNVTQ